MTTCRYTKGQRVHVEVTDFDTPGFPKSSHHWRTEL